MKFAGSSCLFMGRSTKENVKQREMAKRKIPIDLPVYMENPADYYQREMEKALGDAVSGHQKMIADSYVKFVAFLFEGDEVYEGPFYNALSVPTQVSFKQYCHLVSKRYPKGEIQRILVDMENDGKWKSRKYKILARVMENWLDSRAGKTRTDSSPSYVPRGVVKQ